jgi:phage regulator Rha-like protein
MQELIVITSNEQGSLLVDSVDFAAGLDIQHKNLLETIKAHREAIEADFGLIAFETRKVEGRGRPETFALLTEDQALFVGTLSRNSARVIAFKSVLVRSFAEARKRIEPAPTPALPSQTEQMILQLMQQQSQLMSNQQMMLEQLRADMNAIQAGQRPTTRRRALPTPVIPPPSPRQLSPDALRRQVVGKVNEYCDRYDISHSEAYKYLYRRLNVDFRFNVYDCKAPNEKPLDAVERFGYMIPLLSIVDSELVYREE